MEKKKKKFSFFVQETLRDGPNSKFPFSLSLSLSLDLVCLYVIHNIFSDSLVGARSVPVSTKTGEKTTRKILKEGLTRPIRFGPV